MNILCFGDSNTFGISPLDGKRLPAHERWPGILAERLGSEHLVIEAGQPNRTLVNNPPFNGDKSGVKYLKPYLEAQPLDVVIIQLGTNDLKVRFDLTPKQIADGLEQLIIEIKHFYQQDKSCPSIVVLGPPKIFAVGQYQKIYQGAEHKSKELGQYFAQVAKSYQCKFLNCYQFISPCENEGIHLAAFEHKNLGSKVASIIQTKI